MPTVQSTGDDKFRLFWDNYLNRIHKSGVKPPFDRWYVKRAEEYISAYHGKRLSAHDPGDVETYLREAGRTSGLKDWQFRQIVDAIQNLFEQVGVPWHSEFDWGHWRDSARSLGKTHPTVARS